MRSKQSSSGLWPISETSVGDGQVAILRKSNGLLVTIKIVISLHADNFARAVNLNHD